MKPTGKMNTTDAYTPNSLGKKPNVTGTNAKNSLGLKTGIDRGGDPKGAAPMSSGEAKTFGRSQRRDC